MCHLKDLLLEDLGPLLPDKVKGEVAADVVGGEGGDDGAAVLLADAGALGQGHVQEAAKINGISIR